MAHASRSEALKTHEKKRKHQVAKQKAKFKSLPVEEQKAILEKRNEKTLKDKIQTLEWDLDHKQFSRARYKAAIKIINERITEIMNNDEDNNKIYKLKALRSRLE